VGLVEEAGNTLVDDLVGGAAARRHDRQAGGECLDHGHPQSLRGRGEDEEVGRGIGRRQILASKQARKDRRGAGELFLEVFLGRSLADDGEAGVGVGFEGGLEALDALLGSEPAYVEEDLLLRVAAGEPGAPLLRGFAGVEEAGVDALRPEANALDPLAPQVVAGCLGGTEVEAGPVVPSAYPVLGRVLQKPESVEACLGRHVRVVGGHKRDPVVPGVERPARTQDKRVDRVD
jgi:hypothetical protein